MLIFFLSIKLLKKIQIAQISPQKMNKTTLSLVAWKFRVAHLELNGMKHQERDYLVD